MSAAVTALTAAQALESVLAIGQNLMTLYKSGNLTQAQLVQIWSAVGGSVKQAEAAFNAAGARADSGKPAGG